MNLRLVSVSPLSGDQSAKRDGSGAGRLGEDRVPPEIEWARVKGSFTERLFTEMGNKIGWRR